MSVEEIRQLGDFKPHAVAGFIRYLEYNKLAIREGDIFKLNQAVLPNIKEYLSSHYN